MQIALLLIAAIAKTAWAVMPDSLPCGFQVKEVVKSLGSPIDLCPLDGMSAFPVAAKN
jgi:hypothetical protein